MTTKIAKEKTIPFSTRMKGSLKKAAVEYCDREGIKVQRFIEDAVVNELQRRRDGAK